MVPMVNIMLGEIIFGGVGSGLYGMLLFAIVAVFVAGLMVGRTPEYLGKKIEAKEVKMAMLAILILPLSILGFTALAVVLPAALARWPMPARTASARSSTPTPRPPATTAAPSPALPPTRRSTTRRSALAMLIGRFLIIVPDAGGRRLAGRARRSCRLRPAPSRPMAALFVGLVIGVI